MLPAMKSLETDCASRLLSRSRNTSELNDSNLVSLSECRLLVLIFIWKKTLLIEIQRCVKCTAVIERVWVSCCRCLHTQPFLGYSDISVASREVNERFKRFLPHFAFPGYAPGTIAINVTRLERGFNACKTPRCIYPSVFNHFWDIASYWSKITTFSYPTSV